MTALTPFHSFDMWRENARLQLQKGISPDCAHWKEDDAGQDSLFATAGKPVDKAMPVMIPKDFMTLAKTVSCHSDTERWALLYAALWRLTRGEKHLLMLASDPLVRRLRILEKAVRRDAHKAKAFVRFRLLPDEDGEHFIAWHRPDHDVLPIVAPFFQRRFAVMRWTILTPHRSVHWDGTHIVLGEGVPEDQAPAGDDGLEDLWRTYYRATFNPARIKLNMMRREMPVRYWATMPETRIIPELLSEAPGRVAAMIAHQEGMEVSAADFLPVARDLPALRQAAQGCQGCPLYRTATCTVFGNGPHHAPIMIVGEQPGDEEDRSGQPFTGPAGRMLDRALAEAGLQRSALYITNAVKHFKFEQRGEKRLHATPNVREINACRPWLAAEIAAVKPAVIVALGATAGRSLLGPGFTLKTAREQWHQGPEGARLRASWHPAAILRATDPVQQDHLYQNLVEDLRYAAPLLSESGLAQS